MTTVQILWAWIVIQWVVILLLLQAMSWQWIKARRKRRDMQYHIDGVRALASSADMVNRR